VLSPWPDHLVHLGILAGPKESALKGSWQTASLAAGVVKPIAKAMARRHVARCLSLVDKRAKWFTELPLVTERRVASQWLVGEVKCGFHIQGVQANSCRSHRAYQ